MYSYIYSLTTLSQARLLASNGRATRMLLAVIKTFTRNPTAHLTQIKLKLFCQCTVELGGGVYGIKAAFNIHDENPHFSYYERGCRQSTML